jgi:hypothetical protein
MSWTEWVSVLMLSQMWGMKWIHDLALQKIKSQITSSDEWIVALQMSTDLKIQDLRNLAISMIVQNLSSLEKIKLGTECNIQRSLLQGYTEFVMRQKTISVEDEEKLGQSRTSNLFRVRHRRLGGLLHDHDVQSDIRKTFANEFTDVAAFDCSSFSHLRSELYTATDPGVIQRDEEYYCVYIIFSVRSFKSLALYLAAHLTSGGRHFVQATSLSVRGKLGHIPRHVFPPCSRRHLI